MNSVLPRWVRTRLKALQPLLDDLRDRDCGQASCAYCREYFHAPTQLQRFYDFQFRDAPVHQDGSSLQEAITAAGFRDQSLLALLPTGAGKSVCYQLPALLRHLRRGRLTIVISPLQALMKDQVDGLARATGSNAAGAISGLLSPWERADMLESVRMGDIGLLYISPEQLRNRTVTEAIESREIGAWVFDEAHCISKWGHDFRPDYFYAAKFIRELARRQNVEPPTIACFTATGQAQVKADLRSIFEQECGHSLDVFEASPDRINLKFEVIKTTSSGKHGVLVDLVKEHIDPASSEGVCLIFASTRRHVETIAEYLEAHQLNTAFFHAGLEPEERKDLIDGFLDGQYRVMVATNAFGMGIDKSDVRLVVHADIPGSLENYIQEAGRAGRDGKPSTCVLLYDDQDIETQFQLAVQSRLSWRDISQVLSSLRRAAHGRPGAELILTTDEILGVATDDPLDLAEDEDSADTKVRAALAWLERREFLERQGNRTRIFQAKLVVTDEVECERVLQSAQVANYAAKAFLAVWREVGKLAPGRLLSADEIMRLEPIRRYFEAQSHGRKSTSSRLIFDLLTNMEQLGLIARSVMFSAEIYGPKTKRAARLADAVKVEEALLTLMKEKHPSPEPTETLHLDLRRVRAELLDRLQMSPARLDLDWLRRVVMQLGRLRKGLKGRGGLFTAKHSGNHAYTVAVPNGWGALERALQARQALAQSIEVKLRAVANSKSSKDSEWPLEISFELSDLESVEAVSKLPIRTRASMAQRTLLYLHDLECIVVRGGLAILRQAMTIRLSDDTKRRFTAEDYRTLGQHYERRLVQVHAIQEFARIGANHIQSALALAYEYFRLSEAEFIARFFRGRREELRRALSREAHSRVVESLVNVAQQRVVTAPAMQNQLILAGPGSGKTKTVVHRVAYLICVHQIPPRNILVACFNRSAALELRKRLRALIGSRGVRVTIQTYHGVAMRLTGAFIRRPAESGSHPPEMFDDLIGQALEMLRSEDATHAGGDPDPLRDRILRGYSHILVDEYQDIDEQQYELVRAIAGRWSSEDSAISILAVGDDDQTIYDWRGANTEYIRRFTQDFIEVHEESLVENYRSTANIISGAEQVISQNCDRMKSDRRLRPNRFREHELPGGRWETRDPRARGRIQILRAGDLKDGLLALASELKRLKSLGAASGWEDFAVLCRSREGSAQVRDALEREGIPSSWALPKDLAPPPFRVREFRGTLDFLATMRGEYIKTTELARLIREAVTWDSENPWGAILENALQQWIDAEGDERRRVADFEENLIFLCQELSRECRVGHGVHLSTVHGAKGLEFNTVFVVDDGWSAGSSLAKTEAERRLLYVAMTRARQNLGILDCDQGIHRFASALEGDHVYVREIDHVATSVGESGSAVRHSFLGMCDINLGFAGGFQQDHPIHDALAQLRTGDPLRLRALRSGVELSREDGTVVGRLSKAAAEQWAARLGQIRVARVLALVERRRDDGAAEYRDHSKVERWEAPLVEVQYG